MKRCLILALCLILCASFLDCSKKKEETPQTGAIATPGDIMEIVSADGRFTTLLTAIEAAGLAETLKGEGPFTVFAPTDSAFAKLPPGTVESLLQELPKLKEILLYHVVSAKAMAADLVKFPGAATMLGPLVNVTISREGAIMVNDAKVVIPDIEAKNGVIHVIDGMLLPPATAAE